MSTSSAPTRRTLTIAEAADLLGISHWLAGEEIRRTDALCGVKVIRIGRRVLIPRAELERVADGQVVVNGID